MTAIYSKLILLPSSMHIKCNFLASLAVRYDHVTGFQPIGSSQSNVWAPKPGKKKLIHCPYSLPHAENPAKNFIPQRKKEESWVPGWPCIIDQSPFTHSLSCDQVINICCTKLLRFWSCYSNYVRKLLK